MQGYRLTDQMVKEGFSGGTVRHGPLGEMFDVGKAIQDATDGIIYTDDDLLGVTLAQYPALERVPDEEVPEDAVAIAGVPSSFVTSAVPLPRIPQLPESQPIELSDPVLQSSVSLSNMQDQGETAGEGEIPADHADDPSTPEEAIKAGEAVSGLGNEPRTFGNTRQ